MQSENKNDSVRLSDRYLQYTFAKRHLGGERTGQVFPLGESNSSHITQLNEPKHSNNRVYGEDGISPTLNTAQGGNRQPKIGIDTGGLQNIATAIDANYSKGNGHRGNSRGRTLALDELRIRRLTPTECERLMGLPDGWTSEGINGVISDSQRYKLCGNGVVVNVVEAIISKIFSL